MATLLLDHKILQMTRDDVNEGKPLLLYDGECDFCCRWVGRWEEAYGESVTFASSKSGEGEWFGIPSDVSLEAVKFIEPNKGLYSGAGAVLRLMDHSGGMEGRFLWWLYGVSRIFRILIEAAYRVVAKHRPLFAFATRVLWGGDVLAPRYTIATVLFLRLLGFTFAVAFAGLWWQVDGLLGTRGILPAEELLVRAHALLGSGAYWQLPTVFWVTGAGTMMLQASCAAGSLLGLILMIGPSWRLQGLVLLALEILYLSLVSVGQVFMGYQWDSLLLETGFLSLFLARWPWTENWPGFSGRASRWLLVWLLLRLMVSSALIKWNSGDTSWRDLTALDYHFWTQPLPNPGGWLAGQFPHGMLWWMTVGMFAVEFLVPWLLFAPRNARLFAGALIAMLQVLIMLTGNYGFFNILALSLCVLVVDDRSLVAWFPSFFKGVCTCLPESSPLGACDQGWVSRAVKFMVLALSLSYIAFSSMLFPVEWIPRPALMQRALEVLSPLRVINGYGLFAVMTKERREIILQGSEDGIHWKDYNFLFKPGDSRRMPPVIPLLMPRLDWQMWFAALGNAGGNPWLNGFVLRLLEGEQSVLHLMDGVPFHGDAPLLIRARTVKTRFSSPSRLLQNGNWWEMSPDEDYFPAIGLRGRYPSP